MDRTVVIMVLLAANLVIIAAATFTLFRRGPGRDERDVAQRGMLAQAPLASGDGSSIAGPMQRLTMGTPSADPEPETVSIGPSTPAALVGTMSDAADSEPSPLSTAQEQRVLTPDDDAHANMMDSALVHGTSETRGSGGLQSLGGALIDPDTGLATRRAWDEAFRNEDHRLARYHRAVTIVVFELDGLDALATRLGKGPADRLIVPVARTMRAYARLADILARVGHTRFAALLPETDEIAAINYSERVRSACDMWLAAGAVAVRLAIGWAQPPAGGTLGDALRLADDRLNGDRRRQNSTARPVGDAQPADPPDAGREPAPASFVAGLETPGPSPAPAPIPPSPATPPAPAPTPAGANSPIASGRPEHFEALLADFLDHPGATGTIPDPISNADDET